MTTTIAQGGEGEVPTAQVSADRLLLRYFDQVLPLETRAINARREKLNQTRRDGKHRPPVQRLLPPPPPPPPGEPPSGEPPQPPVDPYQSPSIGGNAPSDPPPPSGNPDNPDLARTRPKPEPRDCTGLSLSGGGIRSASFCLGVLQALRRHGIIDNIDYLSTVSGGGYTGASLVGGLSRSPDVFPFGDDVSDSPGIGHIRNYSNYLLPRGRSSLRNFAEAAAVILRGLLANTVAVVAFLVLAAWVFDWAFDDGKLKSGGFLPRLADALLAACGVPFRVSAFLGDHPFNLTIWLAVALSGVLIYWVLVRSWNLAQARRPFVGALGDFVAVMALTVAFMAGATIVRIARGGAAIPWADLGQQSLLYALGFAFLLLMLAELIRRSPRAAQGDAGSIMLLIARWVFVVVVVSALLDLEPLLVAGLDRLYETKALTWDSVFRWVSTTATTFAAIVAFFSSRLGDFLKTTQHSSRTNVIVRRVLARLVIYAASLVFPLVLLSLLLHLAAWGLPGTHVPNPLPEALHDRMPELYGYVGLALLALILPFKPNAYSLHRFYRDRLAKAFLFDPANRTPPPDDDLVPLDGFKLSTISDVDCPYHIVNAAMNVQGSVEANRRGRDADFFIFTRDVVGSDLTMFAATDERLPGYAHTRDMEDVDPDLDLATAMAISGAAVSANMGSSTVRTLSPTLALLNIRLGYWLRNPRSLARTRMARGVLEWLKLDRVAIKFYLLLEMFNLLDENQRYVFLSDGGHIENLGVYELLKRGCQIIIAVDAEADPAMAFPSLMRLQRYARIDLGVRIDLPWQDIATMTNAFSASLLPDSGRPQRQRPGPHVAVGRITYATGVQGILVYIKSSMTGDERDYIIDYKKRNQDFPHETTGDQFFSEEQLEAYRALGFHAADGFFSQTQNFEWPRDIWPDRAQVMADVRALVA